MHRLSRNYTRARRVSPYVDFEGNPVERDPERYPYAHSGYVTWAGDMAVAGGESAGSVDSDRLNGQSYTREEYARAAERHLGKNTDCFDSAEPAAIEAFLADLMGRPGLRLRGIMKCRNTATGYPLWHFRYAAPRKGGR